MTKILITGSTGFLGCYLKDHLDSRYDCLGISTSSSIKIDVTNLDSFNKIEYPPDIIIHTAASFNDDLDKALLTNQLGTLNVCKFAKTKRTPFVIFTSSISAINHVENEYYNSYGQSKDAGEKIAQEFCAKEGISLAILRFSQIYDFYRKAQKKQPMLYGFIDNIKQDGFIKINGKKNPKRNYIDINYVLEVITAFCQSKKCGTYNITHTSSYSLTEIAFMIFEIYDMMPKIEFIVDKRNIPSIYIPPCDLPSFAPKPLSLIEGIRKIINVKA